MTRAELMRQGEPRPCASRRLSAPVEPPVKLNNPVPMGRPRYSRATAPTSARAPRLPAPSATNAASTRSASLLLLLVLCAIAAAALFYVRVAPSFDFVSSAGALSPAASAPVTIAAATDAAATVAAAAAAATVAPPPRSARAAWPTARDSGYSSFECIGGSQVFTFGLSDTQQPQFPVANDRFMRVCLLRDVCFVDDDLVYYEDAALTAAGAPAGFFMRAFQGALVTLSYLHAKFGSALGSGGRREGAGNAGFAPTIVAGPRPPGLPWLEDRDGGSATVHTIGLLSFANNWGHVLVDTILSAYAAAQAFGFDPATDVRPLNFASCDTIVASQSALQYDPSTTFAAACRMHLERWLAPAFAHRFSMAPEFRNTCVRQLIIGHESSLSLKGLYHSRASAIRTLRATLHAAYGVAEPPLARHEILVLPKTALSNAPDLPQLCGLVRAAAAPLRVPVMCAEPSLLGARAQLELLSNATLTVSENGSTGYASLFQRPGSSFLSVLVGAAGEAAKETQTFLYNADVQTFYATAAEVTPGTLLVALERAGARLGLAAVSPP
jgi:hypothetical protein